MPQHPRVHTDDEKGFTLVEILVVTLIIAALAAIAIPSFLTQQNKANDAAAKTYARTLRTAEESYFSDNGAYTNDFTKLVAIEPTLADRPDGATDPTLTATGSPAAAYSIEVKAKSGVKYKVTRASNGAVVRSCDSPSKGGCTAASDW